MKCEKCREKEATFYYSCNINGEKTEYHLCADCAEEEGFGSAFEEFFSPCRALLSPFDILGIPMRRMMTAALPQINIVVGRPEPGRDVSEREQKIPEDAGAAIRERREIAALKHRLHEAVQAEDFEKAIELRDQLKALEK